MPFVHRHRSRLLFWAMAGVALLVAHDTIWAVQVGPGERLAASLRANGHGYWSAVSAALVAIGAAALIGSAIRLRRLRSRAQSLRASRLPSGGPAYFRRASGAWLRMAVVVVVGFAVQENVEHAVSHGHLPGIGILHGPEYPLALPVIAVVTLIGALVAATVASADDSLVASIRTALARVVRRAPRRTWRPRSSDPVRLGSPVARHVAGRAPPTLLVAY
jgi:hypothetical protein